MLEHCVENTPDFDRMLAKDATWPCVHELFEREAKLNPCRIALVEGSDSINYAELNVRANRIAHHLISLGVGPENLVGLMMRRSIGLVACILGVLKAGGAYLPLDPDYPKQRLSMMIEDAKPPVLITDEAYVENLDANEARVINFASLDFDSGIATNPQVSVFSNNLAYVMFTSGSTGRPKGVMIEHRSIARLVKGNDYADFGPDNVFMLFAPITFDASTFEIWGALLNGARLAIMPNGLQSLAELGSAIREYGVTTMWLTAGLFHLMVDERIDDLRPLRQLLAGGDVLSVSHVRKVLDNLECDLINGYGPTENTTFTCCYKIPRDKETGHAIPIGKPIANTRIYILDGNRRPVADGEAGELYAGGTGLSRGYLGRPELTSELFIPNPVGDPESPILYRTGDLARLMPDGNVEFLGRIDSQVKIRGYRIEIEEIEHALKGIKGVRESVVVAGQLPSTDKQLFAFVVKESDGAPQSFEIKRRLAESLPAYMVPASIFLVDNLPLTPNGKVDRAALIAHSTSERRRGSASSEPVSIFEGQIAAILAEILGRDHVGTNDNFFDLGANSLQLALFHSRLQTSICPNLKIVTLFQNSTVGSLSRFCGHRSSDAEVSDETMEKAKRQRAAYARMKRSRSGGI